jgi:hypothetical protein
MTKSKLLSAALIAAAMLATPVMARENHIALQHAKTTTDARTCVRAPDVGAFATQPWDNGPPCEPSTVY